MLTQEPLLKPNIIITAFQILCHSLKTLLRLTDSPRFLKKSSRLQIQH